VDLDKLSHHLGKVVAIAYHDPERSTNTSIVGFLLDVTTKPEPRVQISDELHNRDGEWVSIHQHNIQGRCITKISLMSSSEILWEKAGAGE
tara:strand:+ start:2606 stop:2878 length:273 start_codon:yes stop_codon:yes gene_type:complete